MPRSPSVLDTCVEQLIDQCGSSLERRPSLVFEGNQVGHSNSAVGATRLGRDRQPARSDQLVDVLARHPEQRSRFCRREVLTHTRQHHTISDMRRKTLQQFDQLLIGYGGGSTTQYGCIVCSCSIVLDAYGGRHKWEHNAKVPYLQPAVTTPAHCVDDL